FFFQAEYGIRDFHVTAVQTCALPIFAAVVQGYSPDVGWRHIAAAAYAVGRGLPWYVSITDLTIPTAEGIAPGNGALVQAVRFARSEERRVGKECRGRWAPCAERARER